MYCAFAFLQPPALPVSAVPASERHPVVCYQQPPPDQRRSVYRKSGTVAKLAMRQPFVLFKGLTFQKLCLPGAFRPG
ncbi:hypothetical protein FQE77_26600, partial [Escherichia coli]|nr:hypothetical protein [Escherichia coli]